MLLLEDVDQDPWFSDYDPLFVSVAPVWLSVYPSEWFYLLLLKDTDYYPYGFF